jgi:hypothetical protein
MALKDEIFEALVGSIQPDNPGENFSFSDAGVNKVDTLAEELTIAIATYIGELTFRVVSIKGETILMPGTIQTAAGGPNVNPIKISITIDKDNPKGVTDRINSLLSVVKVDEAQNKSLSGVDV